MKQNHGLTLAFLDHAEAQAVRGDRLPEDSIQRPYEDRGARQAVCETPASPRSRRYAQSKPRPAALPTASSLPVPGVGW